MQPDLSDVQNEVEDLEGLEKALQKDANIFLLNHLLMSVQFFKNYDRDNKLLREAWFKEFSLESHHKKCFYVDALLRLTAANIKFSPRSGEKKNQKSQLCPLRIFISSDNIEAAFNPAILGCKKLNVWPQYQFTVRTNEKSAKSGCVSLVQYRIVEEPNAKPRVKPQNHTTTFLEMTGPNSDESEGKNENPIGHQKLIDRRLSLNNLAISNGEIPVKGFYNFENSETRLRPKPIYDMKMNSAPVTSHEIPPGCFQYEEVRNLVKFRRAALNRLFTWEKVLNSAAFKGYFCDLLIERLHESLNLDVDTLDESFVHQEYVTATQNEIRYCITPVITIRDWEHFPAVEFRKNQVQKLWPTFRMQNLLNSLPCHVVPTWHSNPMEENLDYEKMWKFVFPRQEEFLLLHLMHAQVRCYLFALLIYKSVIESEINSASLGPNHLLHLLFWEVHRNFFSWPEDKPAETLIQFLQKLYKKLQNKSLPDFFMPSRNLLSVSLPKDLHKAQSLIRKVIENPVPYMIRAVSELNFQDEFYPNFDYLKLHSVLTETNTQKKPKRVKKEKKAKTVRFQDEQQQWTKDYIKQVELERKADKEAQKLSMESINVNEMLNFDSDDFEKCITILQMFITHFVQVGIKSIQYGDMTQGLLHLTRTKEFLKLMLFKGANQADLKEAKEQIAEFQKEYLSKVKRNVPRAKKQAPTKGPGVNTVKSTEQQEEKSTIKEETRQEEKTIIKEETKQEAKTTIEQEKNQEETEEIISKL